jgi:hypothetical protein
MRVAAHVIHVPWVNTEIAAGLKRVANAAESSGLSGISFMDHYFDTHGNGNIRGRVIEGYTALGFMAALTSTVRLRLLVTGVTYRHPGLLAKVVSTLGRGVGGSGPTRHRGGLVRARAPGIGSALRPGGRTARAPGRSHTHLPADVGPPTKGPSRAATTSWPRRSACPNRSAVPTRRSSLVAAGSSGRSASRLATPTCATSWPSLPSSCLTSSMSCAATVRMPAAPTTPLRSRLSTSDHRSSTAIRMPS